MDGTDRQTQLTEQINSLTEEIAQIAELVAKLEETLTPVLRQSEPSKVQEETKERDLLVPRAMEIYSMRDRVAVILHHLGVLLPRLEM